MSFKTAPSIFKFLLAVWVFGIPSPAFADPTQVISAPCASTPSGSAAGSSGGMRSCADVTSGTVSQVKALVQHYAACYYKGIDLDISKATGTTDCPGVSFGHPCSLVPNNLNTGVAETSLDHNQQSCGTFMPISVSIANCSPPSTSQAALLAALNLTPDKLESMDPNALTKLQSTIATAYPTQAQNLGGGKKICLSADASGTNGDRERSYMRGTFIQALAYYTNKVTNEISCNKTITSTSKACQSLGADVAGLSATTQATLSALKSMLGTQANLSDIDYCSANWDPHPSIAGVDVGQLRQSAQHLCAARSQLEAAFSQLSMCEIMAQTQNSYLTFSGTQGSQQLLLSGATQALDPLCRQDCSNSGSLSQLQSCINSCYQKRLPDYFTTQFSAIWPVQNTTSSCSGGGSSS